MSDYTITDVFEKLLENQDFREQYLLAYLDRFVYNTTDLEKGLSQEERKIAIESLVKSFHFLMEREAPKLSPFDIIEVGNYVNEHNGIEGIRKTEVSAGQYANWDTVEPKNIYYNLFSLIDNYYNMWTYRDIFEREALFHIKLMRIHPFEDGNKRTAKIIMNANLVKQSYPPVIITEGEISKYYKFINNEDEIGFAKFLREKSLQELQNLISQYKVVNGIPIANSVLELLNKKEGGRK